MHLDRLADRIRRVSQARLGDASPGSTSSPTARSALRKNLESPPPPRPPVRLARGASPVSVLARGYSLTFQADGSTLVRKTDDVRDGDIIITRLSSGQLRSRVVSTPRSLS